jgi:hypothetical protein
MVTAAEALARRFHAIYERLAPDYDYRTREQSAKPWADVPENNRRLMIATCAEILEGDAQTMTINPDPPALRSRSCPTCHSIGYPKVYLSTGKACEDAWHASNRPVAHPGTLPEEFTPRAMRMRYDGSVDVLEAIRRWIARQPYVTSALAVQRDASARIEIWLQSPDIPMQRRELFVQEGSYVAHLLGDFFVYAGEEG